MTTISLVLAFAVGPLTAQDAAWEVRYSLPPDQQPEWYDAGYLPKWTVDIVDAERPTVEITGDTEGLYRGHVLIGKRVTLPDPLPPDMRVGFRYQTYCDISREDMKRSGYVGFGIFTPEAFDGLATTPDAPEAAEMRDLDGAISVQQIGFSGEDVTEWRDWESTNIARQLRGYVGQEIVFAMIWGGYHYGDEEWGKLDGWEMQTVTPEDYAMRFWEALDLDRPELAGVKAALDADDIEAAKAALVEHMKARETPPGPELNTATSKGLTDAADQICDHVFRLVGCSPHQLGEVIQWNEDPFDYDQWAISLNRHAHWRTLGQAYAGTGDDRYAREFVDQLTGWVEAMPVYIGPRWIQGPYFETGKAPLTLDAGIRMGQTWFPAYYYFRNSPEFTVDAQVAMLRSFHDHAVHLMDEAHYHPTSNWGTMEANGLLHIGLMLPEFKDSELWRDTAADRLLGQFEAQVYPDGAQMELSPGYHGVTLYNMIWGLETARRVGYQPPEGFEEGLERMYDYYARLAMPNGYAPGLNDSGRVSVVSKLRDGAKYYPEREDFKFWGSARTEGTPPEYTSTCFPYAGWHILRSGWTADDNYLLLDAGPFGSGHQHEDKLHIVVHARGKTLIDDIGNYAYDSSDWRQYAIGARAHNVVGVDGLQQRRRGQGGTLRSAEPLTNPWVTGEDFDYVEGTYGDGYGPSYDRTVTHTRKILFVKPDYWIVVDVMTPTDDGPHEYDATFHLDVESATLDETTRAVTGIAGDAQMTILPLSTDGLSVEVIEGQTEPFVQGWMPTGRHDELRPIPTPVFAKSGAGETVMAYALIPADAGAPLPTVEAVDATDASLAAKLIWPDGSVHTFTHGATVSCVITAADGTVERLFRYDPDE